MERGAMSRGVVMTADDFRHVIEGWLTNFILIAVAVAGVLEVFRAFGFLPPWAARFLFRYRLDENIQLLRSLGMDVDAVRRRNAAASLDSIAPSVLADGVKTRLAAMTINKDVALGSTARIKINGYIDLMGACTDDQPHILEDQLVAVVYDACASVAGPHCGEALAGRTAGQEIKLAFFSFNPFRSCGPVTF
jgi:hypothetical protein